MFVFVFVFVFAEIANVFQLLEAKLNNLLFLQFSSAFLCVVLLFCGVCVQILFFKIILYVVNFSGHNHAIKSKCHALATFNVENIENAQAVWPILVTFVSYSATCSSRCNRDSMQSIIRSFCCAFFYHRVSTDINSMVGFVLFCFAFLFNSCSRMSCEI